MRALLGWVILVLAGCSGGGGPGLFVDLRTDFVGGLEFITVTTEIFDTVPDQAEVAPDEQTETFAASEQDSFIAPKRVAEFNGLEKGELVLRTRLVDSSDETLQERLTVVQVTGNVAVTVIMTRDCRGLSCPIADAILIACQGGQCVDPQCSPETPEFCPPEECKDDVDCATGVPCAEGRCLDGTCFEEADATACGDGQWCNPEVGCESLDCGESDDGTACPNGICRNGECCVGCWDGTACQQGQDDTACGGRGRPCAVCDCTASDRCDRRHCQQPISSAGVGWEHTCVTRSDGTLYCTGNNREGQLGAGNNNSENQFIQVQDVGWETVGAGENYTCALRARVLFCWGTNESGQLGLGDEVARNRPEVVEAGAEWKSLAVGRFHVCAVQRDGTLWCWGLNGTGQLGLGDTDNRNRPTQVGNETNWVQVVAGRRFTCARTQDFSTWCWGDNDDQQVGNPAISEVVVTEPVQVMGGHRFVRLGAGHFHVCGVRDDQTLWCWGVAADGALGLGEAARAADVPEPTQVVDLGWQNMAGGRSHSCAYKQNGELSCWGSIREGETGTGMPASLTEFLAHPVVIDSVPFTVGLAAGFTQTCVEDSSGYLYCTGENGDGQLGLGDNADRLAFERACF